MKKIKNIFIYVIIMLNIVVGVKHITASHSIINYDMQFIYQFADEMAKGHMPYRDFNMLQTPLALFLLSLFFRIKSDCVFVELLMFLLKIADSIMAYQILQIEKVKKSDAVIGVSLWCLAEYAAVYTDLAVFFLLFSFFYYRKYQKENDSRYLALCSLGAFLCFLSKQNIGVLCIGLIVTCYLYASIKSKRIDLRQPALLTGAYIFMLAVWISLSFLLGFGKEFWEYTILGVTHFALDLNTIGIGIMVYIIFILFGLWFRKKPELFILGMVMLFIAYPIANPTHLITASLGIFIYVTASNNLSDVKKMMVYAAILGTILHYSIFPFFTKNDGKYNKNFARLNIDYFEGEALLDYLDNIEVSEHYHIVTCIAGFYDIYLDRYDKYYDLLLKGNLGKHDPVDIVKETVQNDPESIFIVWTGDGKASLKGMEFQIPYEATEYILEHYERIETIYNEDGKEMYGVYVPVK